MITNGSWMTNQMFSYKGVETGLAPTPIGPSGKRASMYNGLGDSIWVGLEEQGRAQSSGSSSSARAECQDIVGEAGVVFPAIPSGTDKAEAAFKAKGIDVTTFLVHVKDDTTFLFPITDHASQVTDIMQPAMDAVMTGKAQADSLTEANDQVNALFALDPGPDRVGCVARADRPSPTRAAVRSPRSRLAARRAMAPTPARDNQP